MKRSEVDLAPTILATALAVTFAACGPEETPQAEEEAVSNLTSAQRRTRAEAVRSAATGVGLTNPLILAGIADAETNLAHCWSEATWACQGPASNDCGGGAVIAGSADGACYLRRGGLSMFQFDAGNYDQTLAREGNRILSIRGSTEAAVDFAVAMLIRSEFAAGVFTREQAIQYMNDVRVDGPTWRDWITTVAAYYNGCHPSYCSVFNDRYSKYDRFTRNLLNEMGSSFWYSTPSPSPTPGRAWSLPLASTTWQIDFNIVNPWVPGWSSCFNTDMSRLVHAGEDWAQSAGTTVSAIGEGRVISAENANYPGWVVVIEHTLTEAERTRLGLSTSIIYSMYGHMNQPWVTAGTSVIAGQVIGTILDQGSNSHVHWEVRTYDKPPLCRYNYPGPGYTGPGTDARGWGYLDPADVVTALASAPPTGTCDNNVPLGGTACASQGDGYEYVCRIPGGGAQQWEQRGCAAGNTCQGDRCAPIATLSPPGGLLPEYTTVYTRSIRLSWNSVPGATSYDLIMEWWDPVAQKLNPYYEWTGLTATNFEVWPVWDARHYAWRVQSCNAQTCSAFSGYQQFFFDGL